MISKNVFIFIILIHIKPLKQLTTTKLDLPRYQIESFTFVFMHFFHKEQSNIFIKGLSFKSRGGWCFFFGAFG